MDKGHPPQGNRFVKRERMSETGQFLAVPSLPVQAGKAESRPFFQTVEGLSGAYHPSYHGKYARPPDAFAHQTEMRALSPSESETSCEPEYGLPCMERSLVSLIAIIVFGTRPKMSLVQIWYGLMWTVNNAWLKKNTQNWVIY